ncbi:MAG: inositol 2-dehydrogenase [Actinomycetota bacterium]
MTPPRRVRIGAVGLGRMGRFHAANLTHRVAAAELVRVADAAEHVARSTGESLGCEWTTSFDDVLGDPDIDAVVIVTPTPFHAEMIERAAAAGKHVFCEKPIAFDRESTERAIDAARSTGVKLQIGFHRRFDPDWRAAVDRIQAGELGDVLMFRTSLRDMRPPSIDYIRTSGGFFVDVSIHDLDTARWMVGEIDEIAAFGGAIAEPAIAEVGDIDTALLFLRFASGALGVIDNTRAAGYGYECSTEVVGSQATARIGNHRRTHVEWLTEGGAAVDWVQDFTERYRDAYRIELEAFAEAVRADAPVTPSGTDALAALVLCQAAGRSLAEGRPVSLDRERSASGVVYELREP